MDRRARSLALALALAAARSVGASAPPVPPEMEAVALRLDYHWNASGRLEAESFTLPIAVASALSGTPAGDRLLVRGFPIAPGERGDVLFERIEIYAPEARIRVVDEQGEREHPRSARVHLVGSTAADPRVRIGLSLDPDGGAGSGLASTPRGVFGLWQQPSEDPFRARYEIGRGLEERLGLEIETGCGTRDRLELAPPPEPAPPPAPALGGAAPTHEATIAFDTDGELLADYGNDTVAANDAIADLVASLNVIYERDLGLRLLQGETILRTDLASDPYESSSTRDQLDEVGAWWEANQGAVERVWVALLSGKGSLGESGCGGAGIAWVDSYCDSLSYSATQVLRCVALGGGSNTRLIGHEVGHNAGSGHTHCYSPEVDQCYNGQSGCFSGTPSCPDHTAMIPGISAGKGTIMSYCHFSGPAGAACGSNEAFFHPDVIARIGQSVDANTPSCVQSAGSDLSIEKSDAEDPIGRGSGLTYTVTVTNLGPGLASGVEVTETLPAGTTLSSTSGCAEDPSGVPTCTLGDIANGETRTFDVTVVVEPSAPSALGNSVSVSAASNDPVSSNDAATEATAVADWPCQQADLALTSADNAAPGPFVTESSIAAGAGYEVGVGESILFRAAIRIALENDFVAAGDFRAVLDPLVDCQ